MPEPSISVTPIPNTELKKNHIEERRIDRRSSKLWR